ncbi:MAG: ABC transporter permease [Bdellovibrionales bacterium]|nr:ABC transporter permease [Bdellovibrionales bacterium]
MRQFFNQFNKDFKQTFFNPVFFMMAGLCCSIWGFVFPRKLFEFARVAGVSPFAQGGMGGGGYNIYETVFISHLSLTHLLLLFIVPIFTMRLISEEKKLRTFDLLLTAPITSTKIVLGKFLAAYAVVLVLVILSFLYPIITSWFAEFNITLLVSAYLSIALLMGVYTAIGLFSSSLSASVMLSVFLGIIFSVALHFVSLGGQLSNNPLYSSVMEYLSVSTHLDNFFRGNIVSSSVVFFFIVIGFFLFMTQRVIESSRWRSQ